MDDELFPPDSGPEHEGIYELLLNMWWWNSPSLPAYRFGGGNLVSSSIDDLTTPLSKPSLPPDIHLLLNILSRLPAESIIRFKSKSSSLPPLHLLDILCRLPLKSIIRFKYKSSSHLLLDILCRLPVKSIVRRFKSKTPSSSSSLSPDLVVQILCHLPVKSIIRFKSVSKAWNTVLTDRRFVNMQFDKTSKTLSRDCFICMMDNVAISDMGFGFSDIIAHPPCLPRDERLRIWQLCVNILVGYSTRIIVGSSKGWVCIGDEPYFQNFIITNPALRLILRVPYPWSDRWYMKPVKVIAGFGYDEYHDDIKLLRIEQPHETSNLSFSKIEIYSLRSRSWESISSSENIEPTSCIPATMLGSRLYWKSSARDDNNAVRIAIFDLCSDTFYVSSPIGRPLEEGITKSRLDVVALREESLAVIYYDYDLGDIWMSTMCLHDLTFKQVETTCLDVPPYSAEKCLDWLRVHHGWITATQNNGDLMVQCCGAIGWSRFPPFDVCLFSLKKNNFVNSVNYPNINPSHVWWRFRESLIC